MDRPCAMEVRAWSEGQGWERGGNREGKGVRLWTAGVGRTMVLGLKLQQLARSHGLHAHPRAGQNLPLTIPAGAAPPSLCCRRALLLCWSDALKHFCAGDDGQRDGTMELLLQCLRSHQCRHESTHGGHLRQAYGPIFCGAEPLCRRENHQLVVFRGVATLMSIDDHPAWQQQLCASLSLSLSVSLSL